MRNIKIVLNIFIMKKEFTLENYGLNCCYCNKLFLPKNKDVYDSVKAKLKIHDIKYYCSEECRLAGTGKTKNVSIKCTNCGKTFLPSKNLDKRCKSKNKFCCQSCAASYNNKHKTTGTRRSKLEKWLEEKLSTLYPDLEIKYCDKTAINSELDIYIPSFRLAFELNGIYHYEPIHGQNTLEKIQRNDANKFQLCQENNISLCIIDTSQQKYVTEKSSMKYLDIIVEIINKNIYNR